MNFGRQMLILGGLHIQHAICTVALLSFVPTYSQHTQPEEPQGNHRPGTYEPELHDNSGKYVPDYRGQYQHIHIPYDGGYGDRGLKYEHDFPQERTGLFKLGPKDHLRFMIDFNFNESGWQVLQFEWIRDGVEGHQFNYVNENKLLDMQEQKLHNNNPGGPTVATKVHVDGEYVPNKYQKTDGQDDDKAIKIQRIIKEVLEYIQLNILPTLN